MKEEFNHDLSFVLFGFDDADLNMKFTRTMEQKKNPFLIK